MTMSKRGALSRFSFLVLVACAAPDPDPALGTESQAIVDPDDPHMQWLVNPPPPRTGHADHDNCDPTIGIAIGCTLSAHPESGCFQRPTQYEGWVLQAVDVLHCACPDPGDPTTCNPGARNACPSSRAGDVSVTRMCNPDAKNTMTPWGPAGGAGCAVAIAAPFVCH